MSSWSRLVWILKKNSRLQLREDAHLQLMRHSVKEGGHQVVWGGVPCPPRPEREDLSLPETFKLEGGNKTVSLVTPLISNLEETETAHSYWGLVNSWKETDGCSVLRGARRPGRAGWSGTDWQVEPV